MKKHYSSLFVLFALITGGAVAQPTITVDDTTSLGDSQMYYVADSFAVDLAGTVGANVTYDYSTLSGYGTTLMNNIQDASTTANASDFPNSRLADDIGGDFIVYRNNNPTDIVSQGYIFNEPTLGQVVTVFDVDPATILEYPYTFGDAPVVDSLIGTSQTAFGPISYSGEVTIEADGHGTLLLPNSVTYSNVLRIKTVENSELFSPLAGTFAVVRTQFQYFDLATSNFPIFVHNTITIDGTPAANLVLSQDPLVCCTDVVELIAQENVDVYPNPTTDNVTVSFNLSNAASTNVSIVNMLGEVVYENAQNYPAGTSQFNVDLDGYSSGIYFVRVQTGAQSVTKKLIVK